MKIAIIGNAGSGKSTLGLKLHNILGIPLFHLDQYFWQPGWQEPEPDEFEKVHNQLCDQDKWIIEGMAIRILAYRIEKADIVIFLDSPTYLCLYRVFKRALTNFGTVRFSSAKGCLERIPDLKFLRYIWRYEQHKKPYIQMLLDVYQDEKQIFIIRHKAEVSELIKKFEGKEM